MLQNSFGVHVSYASVDRGDGSDPRATAISILSRLRVPAGLRDATGEWGEQQEAVLAIPVTDDGHVLTLSADDRVEQSLTAAELRAAFHAQQLTLWLDADGDLDTASDLDTVSDGDSDADDDAQAADGSVPQADTEREALIEAGAFDLPTVRVSTFSHRGPAVARILATALGVPVDHCESGDWSLQRLETSDPTGYWVTSRADLPLVELNRAESASWFVVTTDGGGGAVPFWTDAERDTRAVLDIDAITVPETAEIYRRLLTEGDGSRDELLEVAAKVPLDVDAAHRALIPEALGGVIGERARQRAFIAAFDVPSDLIEAAFDDSAAPVGRRFVPVGWWTAMRETAIAGWGEVTSLTRRQRPIARLADAVRRRPGWGLALTVGELAAGVWAMSRPRGAVKGVGVLLVIDGLIDAAIWVTRIRRSRRG
ncbi:hypothetical protein [Microbacterium saperdae]|uniref:Uncharacterized protein n=1 Tax=Microbacterium saperdae TaxID=69368 RepID=A0A543BPM6_9MICO|nr:hypothetical protein [Microbacterium saperdae]TQL86780.1 hypothetical protein FB560_2444 [Microbacterium saperdae]GGM45458.1 hypothetical protein GCM10010489_15690 [Microbacterium saperdae]